MDFILRLPLNRDREDYIISIIYKFSKMIILLASKMIFKVKD